MSRRKQIFSIPFNGDFNLLKDTLASGRAYETYFSPFAKHSLNANRYGSSERPILQTDKSLMLLSSISKLYRTGLNMLCNSPNLFLSDFDEIEKTINLIPNLTSITISDPLAVELFAKRYPDKDIQASFIMNLDTYEKIRQFADLGGGTVVLPGTIQRNLGFLEKLERLKEKYEKLKIKAIVNLDCASECVFLPWHYMVGMFENLPLKCGNIYRNKVCYRHFAPEDFIKIPFIRPEDVAFYTDRGLIDYFKIIYRSTPSPKLRTVCSAYFSGRYDGNLFDLVYPKNDEYNMSDENSKDKSVFYCDNSAFPDDFIDKVVSCDKNCEECNYCIKVSQLTSTVLKG